MLEYKNNLICKVSTNRAVRPFGHHRHHCYNIKLYHHTTPHAYVHVHVQYVRHALLLRKVIIGILVVIAKFVVVITRVQIKVETVVDESDKLACLVQQL
jgi:hypothetical protein